MIEQSGNSGQLQSAEALRQAVHDALGQALGDSYDCTRVWEAWQVGTMSQDDFSLITDDSDRMWEITDAVMGALAARQPIAFGPDDMAGVMAHYRAAPTYDAPQEFFTTPLYTAPPAPEMSPDFTDSARAAIAWVLWHHQGGSSAIGQPLRYALGMGDHEELSAQQISEAKRYAELVGARTDDLVRSPGERFLAAKDDQEILVLLEALPQPATSVAVPELFVQWLEREMPAGTIIGKPAWWAPKLARALRSAERGVLGGSNG